MGYFFFFFNTLFFLQKKNKKNKKNGWMALYKKCNVNANLIYYRRGPLATRGEAGKCCPAPRPLGKFRRYFSSASER